MSDETTSHSTKLSKDDSQVAGYALFKAATRRRTPEFQEATCC